MRPTRYLDRWSARDRGLAEGLLLYEDSLNAAGLPPHIAQDPDRKFVLDEQHDHAMAVLEREQQREDHKPEPGVRLTVLPQGFLTDDEHAERARATTGARHEPGRAAVALHEPTTLESPSVGAPAAVTLAD